MRTLGILLICVTLGACTQVGPNTIARDRFDYGNAIADSWKRQTLLNLLRLRYAEAPLFLEVTSVINQYSLEGEMKAGYNLPLGVPGDSSSFAGTAKWGDRPTITYVPISGEKLTRRLMKPIDPSAVLILAQGGWPVDFLIPLTVRAVNGHQNEASVREFTGPGGDKFFRFVTIMSQVQRSGDIGVRIEERDKGEAAVLFFTRRGRAAPEAEALLKEMRELLELDPETTDYLLVYGSIPRNDREIAMLTRSVLSIMVDLASWIDVPEEHVAEKRTRPTRVETEIAGYPVKAPIRIHSGSSAPSTALVSVEFRDTWFWLDDRDYHSKRTFAFLQFLFSLMETSSRQLAPVVTVGAGG